MVLNLKSAIVDFLVSSSHLLLLSLLQCEPTLLPEPNHVMLNHLYALSIKDGVMVLSATHRYRKKYVTTLLYKPIWTKASFLMLIYLWALDEWMVFWDICPHLWMEINQHPNVWLLQQKTSVAM